jgi:hypothetical protein
VNFLTLPSFLLAANYPEPLQLFVIKQHGMVLDDEGTQTRVLADHSGRDITIREDKRKK